MMKSGACLRSALKSFRHDRRGSVAITVAIALPVIIGISALALEYGSALQTRAETQRVADMAAFAAAVAYGENADQTEMVRTGEELASLNGVSPDDIVLALEQVPGSGAQGVRATITAERPLLLARVLSVRESLDVRVTALAGLDPASDPACVLALGHDGEGVTLSGGTSLSAAGCAVASNASVTAPCGTSITTPSLSYGGDDPAVCQWDPNVTTVDGAPTRMVKEQTEDPLTGHAGIAAATSRMEDVAAMAGPGAPSVPAGKDIHFGWDEAATRSQAQAAGCDASKSGSTWRLTCTGHELNFGSITIGGGLKLEFNPGAPAGTVYNFSGTIRNTGESMTFPDGIYKIAKGIVSEGGSTTSFGAGSFHVGRTEADCNWSGGRFSVCNKSGEISFDGPSTFKLVGGVYSSGDRPLTLGSGNTNSYEIGKSSEEMAILLEGGATALFADAVGSEFTAVGDISTAGGGCLALPAAAQHDIAGHIYLGGAAIFGAGIYTIDGYLHFSQGGGICPGTTVRLLAEDVTFVLSGNRLPSSHWVCQEQAFCMSGGQSDIVIKAPTSGPLANIAVIGPSGNDAGALLTAGASGSQISGAFYVPNGAFTISGGASAADGEDGCLQLIAYEIELSGGASATSDCKLPGSTGGQAGSVRLVQ